MGGSTRASDSVSAEMPGDFRFSSTQRIGPSRCCRDEELFKWRRFCLRSLDQWTECLFIGTRSWLKKLRGRPLGYLFLTCGVTPSCVSAPPQVYRYLSISPFC